jgi:alpha-glucosidase
MSGRTDRAACSRREFLAAAVLTPVIADACGGVARTTSSLGPARSQGAPDATRVQSPDGSIEFHLMLSRARATYALSLDRRSILEASALGIVVDGVNLGLGVEVERVERYAANERYRCRGNHSEALNSFNGARVTLRHRSAGKYAVDVRVFDDGVAFRYVVPGSGRRIPDEATSFVLPAGTTVWYHDLRGHYEGAYDKRLVSEVPTGQWMAPPVTAQLPTGAHVSITEAALEGYAGMALNAGGDGTLLARLGHSHPASYPFTLRYGDAEAARLARPATVDGVITTPWRVILVGRTLNALVNADIVQHVSPPPDARFFPNGIDTPWVKPGRAIWKYLDGGGENTLETMKEFSRLAGELGFEYHVVEGFWSRWPEADVRDLIDYSRQRGVGIWLWKHSRELHNAEARDAFFDQVKRLGAVGVKIDFLDHEAKEVIELYRVLLEGTARRQLLVNFHGSNKPTGQSRTWPNELTREAVSGMERRSTTAWAPHDTTLPFTRMLAGPLDFTPMLFGERRRETSWAHQIAVAAILTSPLLTFGAHPKTILEHPAVEMIKSIPSVWDETRVLAPGEIGELAVFARRRGDRWFLAVANGDAPRALRIPLDFLGSREYSALTVADVATEPATVDVAACRARSGDIMTIELRAGGGFVARFT